MLAFTVITVVEMDMWRHSATVRRKLRLRLRLRLAVLHRVLVVLVLEDLRSSAGSDTHEILMVALQLYIGRSCWFCDSVLCTNRFCYCFSVFYFGATLSSFSRYLFMVS